MQVGTLTLRPLRVSDEESFCAAVEEFRADDAEMTFAFCFDPAMAFAEYVRRVNCWPHGEELTDGFVSNTFLVAVVEERIVGRVSLRHELNDFLLKYGGHVGYCVVPSARRNGYASEMLRLTLPIAASLGISRVLLTCDEDNAASRRVIEKNGGIFENVVQAPEARMTKRRYWIELGEYS